MSFAPHIRQWRQKRFYRTTVRELRSLPPQGLKELGIPPAEINRLACAAARSM
jgi:uncharacterized protein YjiS (DUF1127 family)